jgi:hypothetical protein
MQAFLMMIPFLVPLQFQFPRILFDHLWCALFFIQCANLCLDRVDPSHHVCLTLCLTKQAAFSFLPLASRAFECVHQKLMGPALGCEKLNLRNTAGGWSSEGDCALWRVTLSKYDLIPVIRQVPALQAEEAAGRRRGLSGARSHAQLTNILMALMWIAVRSHVSCICAHLCGRVRAWV